MRVRSFYRSSLQACFGFLISLSSASFAHAAQLTLAWDPPNGATPQQYVIYGFEKSKGIGTAQPVTSSTTTTATFQNPSPRVETCYYAVAMYAGKLGERSNTVCVAATVISTTGPTTLATITAVPSITRSPVPTFGPPTTIPTVPTKATPANEPVPLPNNANSRAFVGLTFEQPQAGVIGLESVNQGGELVTTFVQDTSGSGLTQKSLKGTLAVSGDYDGDGRADYSTLEPTSSGFTLRTRRSSTGAETSTSIATARKRIVSGCDFTGDKRADILLLPSRAPLGNVRVISETAGVANSRTLSIKGASGAKAEQVVAGSCFDTDGDGSNELTLITAAGNASGSARARYSVLVIGSSGTILSKTALKGPANGILPVPLDAKGPPLIGYYNRTTAGLISKISFVMKAGQASSITSLKVPSSRDIGTGVVKSQGTTIPALMLYTSQSTLQILNLQNVGAGYQLVAGLTQPNASSSADAKLAVAPRSHLLVKK